MTVHVEWDNDSRTIIRIDITGDWTWNELQGVVRQVTAMRAQVNQDVNVIADLSRAGRLPSPFLTQLRRFIDTRPEGVNLTVLTGMNDVIQIFWNILMRVYGQSVRKNRLMVVKTVRAARALIAAKTARAEEIA